MIHDLVTILKTPDQWLYTGWMDILAKYRRTALGPLWLVIVTLISISCIGVLGSVLFNTNLSELFPYVATGMITWGFLSLLIQESCTIFTSQAWLIQNINVSLLSFCLRTFVRNTIIFLHGFGIILLFIIFTRGISLSFLMVIPSIFILGINSICLGIVLGFLSARYRDIIQMVQAFLNILIFLTPVMWKVEMLRDKSYLANFNPLTHFIALIRDPLLGNNINSLALIITLSITVIHFLVACYLYKKFSKRLVFWL
jgi:ABC-type polysaccharide/polyol phosphate export permease